MEKEKEKVNNKENNKKKILNDIKKSFFYSLIAAGVLGIIAAIYSFFAHKYVFNSIAYAYYYTGAISSIVAVPQLYKRNENSKLRKIRRMSPIYGFTSRFSNPYEDKAMMESYEENKGYGFWFGISIIIFALCLFLYGIIMESIYFKIWG